MLTFTGPESVIELLIQSGADVNATTKIKNTILHFAIISGNWRFCEIIIQKKTFEFYLLV